MAQQMNALPPSPGNPSFFSQDSGGGRGDYFRLLSDLTSTLMLWHAHTQQTPNKCRKKLRQLKNSLKHVPCLPFPQSIGFLFMAYCLGQGHVVFSSPVKAGKAHLQFSFPALIVELPRERLLKTTDQTTRESATEHKQHPTLANQLFIRPKRPASLANKAPSPQCVRHRALLMKEN